MATSALLTDDGSRSRAVSAVVRPLELTQRRVIDFCVASSTACCR